MIPFKGNRPLKIKSIDTESRLVIAWGGECKWESTANETESLVATMEMFKKLDCDDGCTTLNLPKESLNYALRWMNFMLIMKLLEICMKMPLITKEKK